jgi:hypothetical protein
VSPRTGRRAGESGTKEAILDAARRRFAAVGYERSTMRAIAAKAGVDPALVHHFYGTKEQLFVAASGFPTIPSEVIKQVMTVGRSELGGTMARTLMDIWDTPSAQTQIAGLLRTALTHDSAMDMLRGFITSTIWDTLSEALGTDDAPYRASLVASQLVGLIMARYIVKVPPLADAPAEDVIAAVGSTLQRYLTGPLSRA